jgi:molybdopterin converting factor small subunit
VIVRVLAFARLRDVLGRDELALEVDEGAHVGDAWAQLARDVPALRDLAATTRIARNGRVAALDELLAPEDELALLPPVGGG